MNKNKTFQSNFLESAIKQFEYYKLLGDKTFAQLNNEQLFWQYSQENNNIAIIVKHIVGNMLSRWTNFLTEDGEKEWRNRDSEFENTYKTKENILKAWEKGWNCLFNALKSLTENDFDKLVYIRNHGHTVQEAITRQLCHYSYHVGQLVYLAKMIKDKDFISLSVPKNQSASYNENKFAKGKTRKHFTEDL